MLLTYGAVMSDSDDDFADAEHDGTEHGSARDVPVRAASVPRPESPPSDEPEPYDSDSDEFADAEHDQAPTPEPQTRRAWCNT